MTFTTDETRRNTSKPVQTNQTSELALRAKTDKDALGQLLELSQATIVHALSQVVPQRIMPDAIAETHLQLIKTIARYEPNRGTWSTFSWTVARRIGLTLLRRSKQDAKVTVIDPTILENVTDHQPDPSNCVETAEEAGKTAETIREAFQSLPAWTVTALRDRLAGDTYQETARKLGKPLGTIACTLHRLKQKVAHQIRANRGTEPNEYTLSEDALQALRDKVRHIVREL